MQRDAVLALAEQLVQSAESVLADCNLADQPKMPTRQVVGAQLARHFELALGTVDRRDRGAIYTPPDVVRFIVREAVTARVAAEFDMSMEEGRSYLVPDAARGLPNKVRARLSSVLREVRIVDPAAGAGALLVGAATELWSIARKLREAGLEGLDELATEQGAVRRCQGFEIDADAVAIANAVLALTFRTAEGDEPRVVTRNALMDGLHHAAAPAGWDLIVMNPPYIGEKFLKERLGADARQALKDRDGFAGDLLAHFLLLAIRSLRARGAVSAIVSDTMLTMDSSTELRRRLLGDACLRSVAWCRPFETVAVHAAVVTATVGDSNPAWVECIQEDDGARLIAAPRRSVGIRDFERLPHRPLYKPSDAAQVVLGCWAKVPYLDQLWNGVGTRRRTDADLEIVMADECPGNWTLLGAVTRSGQGLATGDDRRFVGFTAGSQEARRALQRQSRIASALRDDPERSSAWAHVKRRMGDGALLQDALVSSLDLRDTGQTMDLPERKPFRIVSEDDVRRTPLTVDEQRHGILEGPRWVSYETSDRSSFRGGAAWVRDNPVVIDWSAESVALLRRRRVDGPRKPVMRNEDLWFKGGVTHNRVASYLRARLLPANTIFSSESPVYATRVRWLDDLSLVAMLNAPIVEFAIKTFLATRNHLEVGHLRRLPMPVLDAQTGATLRRLASAFIAATRAGETSIVSKLASELDETTRELYGVSMTLELPVRR
jgi:hypothetical protein